MRENIMSQQTEYLKQAELALAAYADFTSNILTQAELKDADFSTSQAQRFDDTYRVITQYTDVTGLSAAVYVDKASDETFLAIRGTEASDPMDLLTDLINIT
jgi:hypothetical protein